MTYNTLCRLKSTIWCHNICTYLWSHHHKWDNDCVHPCKRLSQMTIYFSLHLTSISETVHWPSITMVVSISTILYKWNQIICIFWSIPLTFWDLSMLLQVHFYCWVVSSFMDKYRFIYRFVDEHFELFSILSYYKYGCYWILIYDKIKKLLNFFPKFVKFYMFSNGIWGLQLLYVLAKIRTIFWSILDNLISM